MLKNKKIKILYYEPDNATIKNYENQTYEMVFEQKREAIVQEYIEALSKRPQHVTKKVINLLESEYILDHLLIYNLNPRMKIFRDADSFATAITNYTYFYTVDYELKKIEKTVVPKKLGADVKIGNITNNPFTPLNEVNQIADFPLGKPSYAWLSSDTEGRERLIIYTAEDSHNFSTYLDYKLCGDKEVQAVIERLQTDFSLNVGYDVSIDYLKNVFKKLNLALIVPAVDFIAKNSRYKKEEIKTFEYHYKVILKKEDFEKELYMQIQESFTGKYELTFIENLSGLYTKIGNKFFDSDGNAKVVNADFNFATNAAIIKKKTFLPNSMIEILKDQKKLNKDLLEKLPISDTDVIFYFPAKEDISQDVNMYNGSSIESLFNEIHNYENNEEEKIEDKEDGKKLYIEIKYVDKDGEEIIHSTVKGLLLDKIYPLDEFEYIIDGSGNTWKCRENCKENFIVPANLKESVLVLTYGIVKPNLKVIHNTIYGKTLKEEIVMAYVNELHSIMNLPKLKDEKGLLWKPSDNAVTGVYVSDDRISEVTIIYDEAKQKICVEYENENQDKISDDKFYYEQIGKSFKPPYEKHYEDSNGYLWKAKECDRPSLIVSENEKYNKVVVSYLPECADVRVVYNDMNGEEIKSRDEIKIQIGKKVDYILKESIKDRRGNTWYVIPDDYKPFIVKKDSINEVTYKYDIAKSEIEIRYCNLSGDFIRPAEKVFRQIGSGVVPAPDLFMYDDEQKKWRLQKVEPALLKVKEKGNVITYWYRKANAEINLFFTDNDGNEVQASKKDSAQVGTEYFPVANEKTIYKSNEVWKLVDIRPEKILVKENNEENEIHFIYEKDNTLS